MIELDDCGREMLLDFGYGQTDCKVIMVIKAPRGTMALLGRFYISPDTQCEAIRAFVEEHKNDKAVCS